MNRAPLALIFSQCLLRAPLCAHAQTASQTPPSQMPAQAAAAPADEASTWRARARAEMAEWHAKIDAWTTEQKATGKDLGADASAELTRAWKNAQEAEDRLDKATLDGWKDAKAYYQTTADKLAAAWKRTAPGHG